MATQELEVTLGNLSVGTLVRTRKGARFAYAQDMVDSHPGLPILSLSLSIKHRPYAEGLTESWFGGLLPEGGRLERICRELHCSAYDYFGILEQIGWECAGAVSIRAKGFVPPSGPQSITLSAEELSERLTNLPELVRTSPIEHVSLGGFQDKLVLRVKDVVVSAGYVHEAKWFLPDVATVSTHILKPQPRGRYGGLIEGEAWAMSVAKRAARCSNVALLELDGTPDTLVVERYDRAFDDDTCVRVHQEDCCQALGMAASEMYAGCDIERGSDPTYSKIAACW